MKYLTAIVAAGLAGAISIDLYLSLTLALVFHAATAETLSQWDASNALGNAAYSGGWATAALGMAMHAGVSLTWAAVFVFAATRLPALVERPFLSGASFGLIVRLAMYVVVPLGHAQHPPMDAAAWANNLVAHVAFFGIPVALVARKFLSRPA